MSKFALSLFLGLAISVSLSSQNSSVPVMLEYGSNYEAELASKGEVDTYNFEGKTGDIILLRMKYQKRMGASFKVFDPDGILTLSDWSKNGFAQIQDYKLEKNGVYTIQVFNKNYINPGVYGLSLHKLNNNDYAIHLPELSNITGKIDKLFGVNAYKVDISAGDVFYAQLQTEEEQYGCEFYIYDEDGGKMFKSYNKDGMAVVGPVKFERTGEFSIFILNCGGDGGSSFGFTNMLLNHHQSAEYLSCSIEENASLSQLAQKDFYQLLVPKNKAAILDLRAINPKMEATIEIFDTKGELINSNSKTNQQVSLVLKGKEDASKELDLDYVERLNLNPVCLDLDNDEFIWSITNPNSASIHVEWELNASSHKGSLSCRPGLTYLRTPHIHGITNKVKIIWKDIFGQETSQTKPQSIIQCENGSDYSNEVDREYFDSYLVLVSDKQGNDYSSYGIQVQFLADQNCMEEITCENNEGVFSLSNFADNNIFKIKGIEGESVNFEVFEISNQLEPEIRLYDALGGMVANVKHSNTVNLNEVSFPHSGDFYLVVGDFSGNDYGDLKWSFTPTNMEFSFPDCISTYYGLESYSGAELNTGLNNADHTFIWSTGETTPGIFVSPSESTTYSVTVENAEGCSISKEVFVEVIDITCGYGTASTFQLCHINSNGVPEQKCLNENELSSHLDPDFGHDKCFLGPCKSFSICNQPQIDFVENTIKDRSNPKEDLIWLTPNPTNNYLNLRLEEYNSSELEIKIISIDGTTVYKKTIDSSDIREYQISLRALNISSGIYHVFLIGKNAIKHKSIVYTE